jgi:hypothetical protein
VQEQPKVEDLIAMLERRGKSPVEIISLLSDIIKQQMMYGGSIEEKLFYHIEINKKGLQ